MSWKERLAAVGETELSASQKLRVALSLHEDGVAMMRERFRRDSPRASEAEIDDQVQSWLRHRPGAEAGDAVGRLVAWPRSGR